MRRLRPAAALGLAVLAGCASLNLSEPVTKEGRETHTLWRVFMVAAIVIGGITASLIVYTVIRYRRRRDDDGTVPSQRQYHIPLEVIYTVIPLVVVAALFGLSARAESRITHVGRDDALTVEVVGYQWGWQFRYPQSDRTSNGSYDDPPQLVLPLGRPARLTLVTADVIHSFWVPRFLSKRDLIPGVDNTIEVTPTSPGTYDGRCAEFCGLDHWRMDFVARVVSEDEFQAWLAALPAGQT